MEEIQVIAGTVYAVLPPVTAAAQLAPYLRSSPRLYRVVKAAVTALVVRSIVVMLLQLYRLRSEAKIVEAATAVLRPAFASVPCVCAAYPPHQPLGVSPSGGDAYLTESPRGCNTVRVVPKKIMRSSAALGLRAAAQSGRRWPEGAPLSRVLGAVQDPVSSAVVEEGVPVRAHVQLAGPCPREQWEAVANAVIGAVRWFHSAYGVEHGSVSIDDVAVVEGDPSNVRLRWVRPPPAPVRCAADRLLHRHEMAQDVFDAARCVFFMCTAQLPPTPPDDADREASFAADPDLSGLLLPLVAAASPAQSPHGRPPPVPERGR
eukprot:TRINITY_DN35457_c0_g1_i1.p2 TRINITY_DN35457_c0_g1~~TRINITY_DN35457_c0_g1_i1.p2  ORF type:complete len:318 (+),score=97.06 TRINITY_DN35457_c0_g1_i1:73-1026(+)